MMTRIHNEATVWWDMKSCLVPDDFDVSQVGPCIKVALEELGCHGPITINAMSDLKGIPAQVLESLSSSGIFVRYLPFDIILYTLLIKGSLLDKRTLDTQVFIMDNCRLERLSSDLYSFKRRGYSIVVVHPEEPPKEDSYLNLPWKNVLKYAKISETRLECGICRIITSSLVDFTVHLNSGNHANMVCCMLLKNEETSEGDDAELMKQKTY